LAKAILDGNAAGANPQIPLAGILVGNPYTNPFENDIGQFSRSTSTFPACLPACLPHLISSHLEGGAW
jgi:hypothetical protein